MSDTAKLVAFLRSAILGRWSDGACRSCGWHAGLYEYEDAELVDGLDPDGTVVELPCLGDAEDRASHRGVRIVMVP